MSHSRIADLGRIITGSTPSSTEPHLFGSDVSFLTPSDMAFDRRNVRAERGISAAGAARFKARLLPSDAVAVVCIGATIGKVCMTDGPVLTNQQINSIVVDESRHSPNYIYYLMLTMTHRLKAVASGAATPIINKSLFGSLEVTVPDLIVQTKIGHYLKSFDDLIENNRRRIDILEEMARLSYREWFVCFRLPGHEGVELVDSDLGLIPEGWEVLRVGDALEAVGGGTPSKVVEEYWTEGDVQWFTPTDLTRAESAFVSGSSLRITELGLKKSSAKLFPVGSVMMTSRATIGVISISTTDAATNQGFITCVPSKRLPSNYIYFWLHSNVDLFLILAGGATFKELRKSTFRELPILVPDQQQMDQFEEHVGPTMALIKNLLRQNQVLVEARNLLLPRLVAGELDVSELGLELEAAGV